MRVPDSNHLVRLSVRSSTNSFPDDNSNSDSPIAFKLHPCVEHHCFWGVWRQGRCY